MSSEVIKFANEVYNFISSSYKRLQEYQGFQEFTRVEQHKILYPSQSRWLVMEQVAKRLFEQWPALTLYFASFLESNKPAEAITIYTTILN